MNGELDQAFERMTDFDLVDGVACAIEEAFGYERLRWWPEDVPLIFRVVHFPFSMTGFAQVNGYVEFLVLGCRHEGLPVSLREVGLGDLAEVVEAMLAPIPPKCLGDRASLETYFGGWEPLSEWVDRFEGRMYAASERIEEALARYCRAQRAGYAPLWPQFTQTRAYQAAFAG